MSPPSRLPAALFLRYVRRLTARHLAAVHWSGPPPGPGPAASSLLLVANHTNWWDGFLACLVGARLGLHFQILMEAANLDRYWMFRWIGALPLHRDAPRRAYADLAAAAETLGAPGTGLWIFPQGSRRPPREPVGRVEGGAAQLALHAPAPVPIQPVAIRYAYLGEQLPEAFILLGERFHPAPAGAAGRDRRRRVTEEIGRRLQRTVQDLDARLETEDLSGFELLQPGRLSINKRLDRARHRLGTLTGPFEPRNG